MRLVMIYSDGDTLGFDLTYPIEYSSKEDAKKDYFEALKNAINRKKKRWFDNEFEIFGIEFKVKQDMDDPIFLTIDEWFEEYCLKKEK
jgi:hypothetical protein